jgi:uncharacterized protein YndB with AHSA1/START domain
MTTYAQIGRVSSASVHKGTGKSWDQWVAILDKAGARSWTHPEIVAYLKKRHKLSLWWQQGVTLGFEIATGRRIEGQNAKGQYQVTVTKSLSTGVAAVWKSLVSKKGARLWLRPLYDVAFEVGNTFETDDGFFGEIRTMKKNRRIRMSWQDPNWLKGTYVQVTLVDRPGEKSILVVDHGQIVDLRIQATLRKRWKSAASDFTDALAAQAQSPARTKALKRTTKRV